MSTGEFISALGSDVIFQTGLTVGCVMGFLLFMIVFGIMDYIADRIDKKKHVIDKK